MFKDSASRRLVQGPRLLGLRLPGFAFCGSVFCVRGLEMQRSSS